MLLPPSCVIAGKLCGADRRPCRPRCAADAARLLEATARAADARPDTPLITMSMGPLGAVTRFCGGAFGSCASLGVTSGTSASAPGEPPAEVLKAKLISAPL